MFNTNTFYKYDLIYFRILNNVLFLLFNFICIILRYIVLIGLADLAETSTNIYLIKACEKRNKMVLRFFYIFSFTILLVYKRANKVGI